MTNLMPGHGSDRGGSFGQLLREEVLNLPRLDRHVHASLLPRWRGAAQCKPLFCMMMDRVTIMQMEKGWTRADPEPESARH